MNARPLTHFLISICLIAMLGASCKKDRTQPETQDEDTSFKPAGSTDTPAPDAEPPPPQRPILPKPSPDAFAWGYDFEPLLVADLSRAARQNIFFTGDEGLEVGSVADDSYLAQATIQISLSRGLVHTRLLTDEAKRRGLMPSEQEVNEFIARHNSLKRFAGDTIVNFAGKPVKFDLAHFKVTRDDLIEVATGLLVQEIMRDAFLDDIAKEDLWEDFRVNHSRRRLLVAHVPNIPTSAEIDAFIARDGSEITIKSYYDKNKRRFLSPKVVRVTMLSAPYGSAITEWRDKLTTAAARLAKDDKPEKIASDLKLELQRDVALVRQENAHVFSAKVGDTGHAEYGPRGLYAWRVEAIDEAKALELDNSLRREIAGELLQFRATTSASKLHDELREQIAALTPTADGTIPDQALDAIRKQYTAEQDVKLILTEPFPRNPDHFIPGVGVVESLMKEAFTLDLDKNNLTARAIPSHQRVYLARLVALEATNEQEYKQKHNEWVKDVQRRRKPTILEVRAGDMIRQQLIQIDLDTIKQAFGQTKGNRAPPPAP
jgi:hypothetical protein